MRGLSLRTKIFILFAGAALVIVVPTLLLIANAVEHGVYQRATDDLNRAATGLATNWSLREDALLKDANLRALRPGLSAAWLRGDERRVRAILTDRRDRDKRIGVLALDSAGRSLVGPRLDSAAVAQARGYGTVVTAPEAGGPLRMALAPVLTDSSRRLGEVGVAVRLDSAAVGDLKKDLAGGTDLALVVGDSLIATTVRDTLAVALRGADLPSLLRTSHITPRKLAGRSYLTLATSLPTRGMPVGVVLFRQTTDELNVVAAIRGSLVGIGVVALVFALVLAVFIARIVSRPAAALAEASGRLAKGDYDAPLPPASGDEIGQLARAFGEMRLAIAERESRLRSAQAEMIHREKLAAMGRLVAQLSHEINNPIYNIQNCLEALERRGDPGDPNREFLTLAQEELSRMAGLTRQLLDQSRPLSDAATALDLNEIVNRVLTLASPELRARGIRLETHLARGLPAVVVHPEAIHQVLANLVANAGDAMAEGDVLRMVTRADDDAVEVVVEDTGAGISEEHLPHIFEAFYTTKPGVQGIGLGLFVSDGIIRGHRGRLSVESRAGEGSRFTIRLPRETLDEALGTADEPEAEPAAVA
ncbi:MAG TPA: ATP-binding protein [Longimicrobiaceae bacterium]|jgi:signal transduction histidine kinase|nr:ATP-binding protein [Longimicrobiaceae bacterium]